MSYLEYNNEDKPYIPARDPREFNVAERIKKEAEIKAQLPRVDDEDVAMHELKSELASLRQYVEELTREPLLEGDGAEYYTLAPTALSFRSENPLDTFQGIMVDGQILDESSYTLEEGSTIAHLLIDYLKTLPVGQHEVRVLSTLGTCKAKFNVAAPELNEYGFYYDQPYTAVVDYFGGTSVFFFREDGTMDFMLVENNYTEVCSYTIENGNLTVNSVSGTFTGSATADGIYCNELYTTFVLGDTSIAADEDYIYTYKEDLGGYEVKCIDKTKAEYGAIKTGINGIDTVALEHRFLEGNSKITIMPNIPSGVNISYRAFSKCSSFTEITVPNGVAIIESGAFAQCANLNRIEISASVINISESAFDDCDNLNSIIVDDYNAIYSSLDGVLLNKNRSDLIVCPEGKTGTYIVPDGVNSIGNRAFSSCDNLTSVIIPDGVTSIGSYVFMSCDNLTSLTISNSVTSIGNEVFYNCINLVSITYTGTIAQWNTITFSTNWNSYVPATYVQCTDGQVSLV